MIELTTSNGSRVLVSVVAIVQALEASSCSQGYGIRSIVTLSNNRVVECKQSIDEIARLVKETSKK